MGAGSVPTRRAEILAQRLDFADADKLLECLDERSVRSPDDGVTGAVQHEPPFCGDLARELAYESALARTGLTADERNAPSIPKPTRDE
jgi:hypothetical protein